MRYKNSAKSLYDKITVLQFLNKHEEVPNEPQNIVEQAQ